MKISSALCTLAALVSFAGLVDIASAHDDDGKIRDRQRAVRGKVWREADGGVAGGFASNGVQLKSWFPLNTLSAAATSGNSCWGYISPAGREYAIIGTSDGTAFVEITNPSAAVLKSFQPGPTSLWRDMRVYGQYCYSASEGGSGIQVFDISQLDSTGATTLVNTITAPTTTTAATHTLAIDTVSGYLYRAGGGANGLRIYDVRTNPANPTYVGAWSPIYVHECQVVTYTTGPYAGRQIAFCCGGTNSGNSNSGLYIVDVTNKAAPVQLSYTTYAGARYCHQGWIDENSEYIYINDELDEGDTVSVTTTIVMNISNLSAPTGVVKFNNGNPAIGHNMFVRGTKLYQANYRSGMRVFDLAISKTNPPEIASFDTYPTDDNAQFNGLWNVWPFFPSGTVIGSDLERGLFVWKLGGPVATFAVANAPTLVRPQGGTTVDVTITPGQGQTLNPASAVMRVTSNGSTSTVPLVSQGGNVYRASFPATTCTKDVQYQFEVANTDGELTSDASRSALSAVSVTTAVNDTFEAATGWTGGVAGDTATSGVWVRVDPVATTAQPEDDHTAAPGTLCWITGNGVVGGAAGAADVDAGVTTLLSPVFNMGAMD
ncbi:MAG: choice-of-anchor B family protein, partial [Planctomycetaceae bacterium]|nr:choice-of-anchor B family protein [Planctomycetaceae bacterium]